MLRLVLNYLENEDIDILLELLSSDKKKVINTFLANSKNRKEILKKILPILKRKDGWDDISYEIFELIYLDSDFTEYTYYLLHKEYVNLNYMSQDIIKSILENTTWGLDYVIKNLNNINYDKVIHTTIDILIKYVKEKQIDYNQILEKIMNSGNQKIKDQFIMSSFTNHLDLSKNDIIATLYKNSDDYYYKQEAFDFYVENNCLLATSKIPSFLLFYAKDDNEIRNMMIDNLEIFLDAEVRSKMKIIESLDGFLPKKSKYDDIYKLYKTQPHIFTDESISILMNSEYSKYILNMLKDKEITYLKNGTTTQAFRIDDSVLKLSLSKHEFYTIKDLFLISPTKTMVVYDEDNMPILIIEIQKFLDKKHNGQEMTEEDVENFLIELDNLGYVTTDPNNLDKRFDNFGFLDDYHDANLGDFSSHEDLPEWFKERPIVLYDVDLVYNKDSVKKKTFDKRRVI